MEQQWPQRVQQIMKRTLELAKTGEIEQALGVLDSILAEATRENQGAWIRVLCGHAAVLSHIMGDLRREIRYTEQSLPYATDYRFAVYNLAQLLLRNGQVELAERYAAKAYQLSITEGTESDGDLVAAIVKQWPNVDKL